MRKVKRDKELEKWISERTQACVTREDIVMDITTTKNYISAVIDEFPKYEELLRKATFCPFAELLEVAFIIADLKKDVVEFANHLKNL